MSFVYGLIKFCLWLFAFMAVFLVFTDKYVNHYKLCMIFGKKGAGKSTTLARLARKHLDKGWTVYSTEHMDDVYYIPPRLIGYVELEDFNYSPFDPNDYKGLSRILHICINYFFPKRPKVLLLIDEVGSLYDNRDYKNFKPQVRDWFKLQRHRHCKCYMFSQTFDVDKKLRDLTDSMYLICNLFRVFTYGKRINKFITIKESATDDSSSLAEGMKFDSFIFFLLGSRTLLFIPKWAKYFDSFVAPALPKIPEESWELQNRPSGRTDNESVFESDDVGCTDDSEKSC